MEWLPIPTCCAAPVLTRDERFRTQLEKVCERVVQCRHCAARWIEEWTRTRAEGADVDAFRFLRGTHAEAVKRMGLIEKLPTGRVVRCPKCRSLHAAEVEHLMELTPMRCGDCRYEAWEDHYGIVDDWNVDE